MIQFNVTLDVSALKGFTLTLCFSVVDHDEKKKQLAYVSLWKACMHRDAPLVTHTLALVGDDINKLNTRSDITTPALKSLQCNTTLRLVTPYSIVGIVHYHREEKAC